MDFKIYQKNETELYNKAEEIKSVSKEDKDAAAKMFNLMKQANGMGLSASQIGYSRNIITVSYGPENHIMYNPEILRYSDKKIREKEGCLSFPGEKFKVERSATVLVQWLNGKNQKKTKMFSGVIAKIIQHEVDHNKGITMEMRHKEQNPEPVVEVKEEPKKKRGRPSKKKKAEDDDIF